jgi:hypothetical protein
VSFHCIDCIYEGGGSAARLAFSIVKGNAVCLSHAEERCRAARVAEYLDRERRFAPTTDEPFDAQIPGVAT